MCLPVFFAFGFRHQQCQSKRWYWFCVVRFIRSFTLYKTHLFKCVYLFFRPKPFPRPGNVYPSPSPFSKVRELLFDEKKDGSGGDGTISINRTFHPVCKAFSIQATPSWRKRLTHTHSLLRSRGLLRDDAAMDCEIFTD